MPKLRECVDLDLGTRGTVGVRLVEVLSMICVASLLYRKHGTFCGKKA